mmetsp:Transcript_6970/g.22080  ORF Transcript_6970/g.22080 Transcript_6970/m.22080 type:complete len:329 (+) Transcript_6970:144-1130(+)
MNGRTRSCLFLGSFNLGHDLGLGRGGCGSGSGGRRRRRRRRLGVFTRCASQRTTLHAGDECCRPPSDCLKLDRSPCCVLSRLAVGPAIVEEPLLRKLVAVCSYMNSLLDDVVQRVVYCSGAFRRKRVGSGGRVHTRLVEDLIRDPVANPSGKGLVKQHGFHWDCSCLQTLQKCLKRDLVRQRVKSKLRDGRRSGWVLEETDATQATRVGEREPCAILKSNLALGKLGRPSLRIHFEALVLHGSDPLDSEGACHTKVERRMGRTVQLKPKVLALPMDLNNGAPHECLLERFSVNSTENHIVKQSASRSIAALEHDHFRNNLGRAVLAHE